MLIKISNGLGEYTLTHLHAHRCLFTWTNLQFQPKFNATIYIHMQSKCIVMHDFIKPENQFMKVGGRDAF